MAAVDGLAVQGVGVGVVVWGCGGMGGGVGGGGWGVRNAYELLNLRALKISICIKVISFNVWVRYFVWNFKGYLWNSTQNIWPIHWKMWILFSGENLRALRFKSSYVFSFSCTCAEWSLKKKEGTAKKLPLGASDDRWDMRILIIRRTQLSLPSGVL